MKFQTTNTIMLLTISLAALGTMYGQAQTEYAITIEEDGSALWLVRQTLEINASLDTIDQVDERLTALVTMANNITGREMKAYTISWKLMPSQSSILVEYEFMWQNFTRNEGTRLVIGDVFEVPDFFAQLYGDGEILIKYPPSFIADTVSPTPQQRDDSTQMLLWSKGEDFINGWPVIILTKYAKVPGYWDAIEQNSILIAGLTVAVVGSSVGLYAFKRYNQKKEASQPTTAASFQGLESDEEKILRILKASGGTMSQSLIVDECRFSKAKTSQLLTALENKELIKRYKKGRDKIVTVKERKEK